MRALQIKSASIVAKSGVTIIFESYENLHINTKLLVIYDGKDHYYNVNQIDIAEPKKMEPERLLVRAIEVGYYVGRFDRINLFDIRLLLDLRIDIIKDDATIKKIANESNWC